MFRLKDSTKVISRKRNTEMNEQSEIGEFGIEVRKFARELPRRIFSYCAIIVIAVGLELVPHSGWGPGSAAFVLFVLVFFPSKSFWEALRRYLRRNDTLD